MRDHWREKRRDQCEICKNASHPLALLAGIGFDRKVRDAALRNLF
jgi:hypothetical protein